MEKFTVYLKSIRDVKDFVRIVNDFPYEVDLASGRYVVDAKSIMGIFSLDLTQPIDVEVHADHCDDLKKQLQDYILGSN